MNCFAGRVLFAYAVLVTALCFSSSHVLAQVGQPSISEFNRWAGIDLPDGIDVTSATKGPDHWYLEGYALTQQVFDGFVDTIGGLGQAGKVNVLRNEERSDHRRRFRLYIAVPQNVDTIIIDDGSSTSFPQIYPGKVR